MTSPPSVNNQDKWENNDEPKLSVEEKGGTCQDPAFHQEENDRECKGMLFKQQQKTEFIQELTLMLYLMFGTRTEIDKQVNIIRKKMGAEELAFLGNSSDSDDNYAFSVPLCGQGYKKVVLKIDANICSYRFNSGKSLVSIADIKKKSKLCLQDGTSVNGMRLHGAALPYFICFSLLRKKCSNMRTPTKFKVILLTMDEDLKEIRSEDPNHTTEIDFPACFYNPHADLEKDPTTGADKKVLEDNHHKILQEIKNWHCFIQWFVDKGVLNKEFLKFLDGVLSEENKGEVLKNLYGAINIFPDFIEALKSANNEELAEHLLQCKVSLGNQNSSL